MTTVCFDGRYLAADTLFVYGSKKLQGHYEKIHLPDGKIWTVNGLKVLAVATAGAVGAINKLKLALEAGVVEDFDPKAGDNAFQMLMVTEEKYLYYWNYGLTAKGELVNELYPVDGNHAIGSGSPYGLAVMAIKGSALDGVRAAMKVDLHTGGYIDVFDYENPLRLMRVDPVPVSEEVQEKPEFLRVAPAA